MKVWNMKFIYVFVIILSIYKSCDWNYFFHGMVFEIILNREIQIFFFSNWFIYLKKNVCVHYWKKIKFKLQSCHLDKIVIRYQSSKMMLCVMFEIK
jgi:hypothetical protein